MKKVVKIGNNEYTMKSSAYTQFKYRNDTGRRLLDDIQKVSKLASMSEEEQLTQLDDLIELLLRMAFIMAEEADSKQVTTFEAFLKGIDGIFEHMEWINDVIELATNPLSRGIQAVPQNE